MKVTYSLDEQVVTLNKWRTLHYYKVAKIRKEWRESFFWLYKKNPVKFEQCKITVMHESKRKASDPVACAECYKSALDGLVDGGMLEDDDPTHVTSVTFLAPKKTGRDRLSIIIEDIEENDGRNRI